jgi:quinolinate synthase
VRSKEERGGEGLWRWLSSCRPALLCGSRRPCIHAWLQVWIQAELDASGRVQFSGTSDSELTRGLCALLVGALSGLTPDEVLAVDDSALQGLNLGPALLGPSRVNGFANMLETMRRRTRMLLRQLPRFPSLLVTADSLTPQGAFAEAQAQYLEPDPAQVDRLVRVLSEKKMGVVAHFYMDPEVREGRDKSGRGQQEGSLQYRWRGCAVASLLLALLMPSPPFCCPLCPQVQGVLMSAAERWPHIYISDSLVMADTAVAMAEAGCK